MGSGSPLPLSPRLPYAEENSRVDRRFGRLSGSHSENVYLNAWTMYTQFPYNISQTGGWHDELGCMDNGTIKSGGGVKKAFPLPPPTLSCAGAGGD